jgi:hypothetical protein
MSKRRSLRQVATTALMVTVAVGTMAAATVALGDEAGAATPHATHLSVARRAAVVKAVHLDCRKARRWLHHEKKLRVRYSTRLTHLKQQAARAQAAGLAVSVAHYRHDIGRVQARRAKALRPAAVLKHDARAKSVNAQCVAMAKMAHPKAQATKQRHAREKAARAKARARMREAKAAEAKAAAKAAAAKAAAAKAKTTPVTTPSTVPPATTTPTTVTPATTPSTVPPATTPPTPSSSTTSTTAP